MKEEKTLSRSQENLEDMRAKLLQAEGKITDEIAVRMEIEKRLLLAEERLQAEITEHEETKAWLQRARDELTTIMAVSQVMVSTLKLDDLLDLILDQLQVVVNYSGAAVVALDQDAIEFQAYKGHDVGYDTRSFRVPVQDIWPLHQAIIEQQPFIIRDVWQDALLAEQFYAATGLGIDALFGQSHAWMGVAMTIGDRVIGLLGLTHQEPGHYQADVLPLMQAFANQAAIAIENARLYEQAQAAAATTERNRLARDLHDSVSQTLFSVSIIADTTPAVWRKNPDEGLRNLEKLRLMTKGALADMRTLLLELRPDAIAQVPLSQLLATLADSTLGRSRIPVELVIDGECSPPDEVKVVLYHVAQEALNNVVKHAEATEVKLLVRCSDSAIVLTVQDNGRGFDPYEISGGHFGLVFMAERLASIDAELNINSVPGQGTEIVATLTEHGSKHDE